MMKKSRGSMNAIVAELRELLSGPSLRAAAGIKDEGEIMMAVIGDDTTNVHDVHEKKRDVWTRFTDVLTGLSYVGRLLAPAGILWRLAPKGSGAHVIRGRKMNAPGAALVIPDGGDGATDNVVPGWLDGSNAGISGSETMHLESTAGDVKIDATADGKKVLLQGGGKGVARLKDTVDLGTWQATFGVGPLSACIVSLSITPPGGGKPIVLAAATPGPFSLTGQISSASDKSESG
jgi:hypothetical protein